ncbi:RNA polymerase, sigma subunit, ECF family [Cognatishimia maritima]|uniref:RNA polymerase, sigma subunit, ECF family n=2 Tax=Cognatishimia maritima TaxID=870908 RepID=A0A1M5UCI8_9RHOB|nr:RNA polymerase, sigma subunit, ECF family [Cognatishimia maritima]
MPRDSFEDVTDDALLVAYANGDPVAAQALTQRLTPKVFGHAYRLLGNRADAEDITQEALIRLWKFAPEWRQGEAKVSTWLYKVVANLCTDRLRRGHSVDLDSVPDPEDTALSAAEQMQQRARLDGLQQGLNALPERQRQAVVLRHIEGLSNPEIAEIMGAGVEAIESLTARGKRTLAKILAERKDELGYTDG